MKKVIFISALAIAAAVSCTKSDIVDTKFGNDVIGFESYAGRDAMTKASVVDEAADLYTVGFGVWGFYTGSQEYSGATTANLWDGEKVWWQTPEGKTAGWYYNDVKYWTNDKDNYSFLAYAPFTLKTKADMTTGQEGTGHPTISYTVTKDLSTQDDVLYATPILNTSKGEVNGAVGLTFNHALSRLTVKASATPGNITFHVKDVFITGKFNVAGTFDLYSCAWVGGKYTNQSETYEFFTTEDVASEQNALPAGTSADPAVDYAFKGTDANNYLMMIPTDFSGAGNAATLTVVYTTMYDGFESNEVKKEIPISTAFAQGCAYAINLAFAPNQDNVISFTVTKIEGWGNENNAEPTDNNPNSSTYPDKNKTEQGA